MPSSARRSIASPVEISSFPARPSNESLPSFPPFSRLAASSIIFLRNTIIPYFLIQADGFWRRQDSEHRRKGLPAAMVDGCGLGVTAGGMIGGHEKAVESLGHGVCLNAFMIKCYSLFVFSWLLRQAPADT